MPEILHEESFSDVEEGICHQFASTLLFFAFTCVSLCQAFAVLLLGFAVHFPLEGVQV